MLFPQCASAVDYVSCLSKEQLSLEFKFLWKSQIQNVREISSQGRKAFLLKLFEANYCKDMSVKSFVFIIFRRANVKIVICLVFIPELVKSDAICERLFAISVVVQLANFDRRLGERGEGIHADT